MRKLTALIAFIIGLSNIGVAQDRFFAFTNQSNVLPKGTRAIELWYANKSGGEVFYRGNFTRAGFKMGLGKNLLTQFYVNINSVAQVESEISFDDRKTRMFSPGISLTTEASFSNETKIKFLDPVANVIGLAAYNEFTIAPKYTRITPKVIMDKRKGNNFFVFNMLAEIEKRWDSEDVISDVPTSVAPKIVKETEIPFEFGLAYMRFFKNDKFGLGFEVRNHNEIIKVAGWEHAVLFMGPALHIQDDKWFFNLTALPQIHNFKKTWIAPNNKVLDEHQRFELRTQLGFMF